MQDPMSWVTTALADLHMRFSDIDPLISYGRSRVGGTISDSGIVFDLKCRGVRRLSTVLIRPSPQDIEE
jgi:hypothetical protein